MNDPRLPALVLLPGMDGTGDLFAPFLAAMGPECKVLCIRYPDDAAMGYVELEVLVRSQLPHDANYVVLGESFSGPIAASLSAAPPPGLMGIVLCCTFLRSPARPVFHASIAGRTGCCAGPGAQHDLAGATARGATGRCPHAFGWSPGSGLVPASQSGSSGTRGCRRRDSSLPAVGYGRAPWRPAPVAAGKSGPCGGGSQAVHAQSD